MAGFEQRPDLIPQFDVEDPNVAAPRPEVTGSAPPRPTAPNAFIRPSEQAAETLRKFKAVQEAGTKRKRAEVRKSFEGPTTAEQEAIDARNLRRQQQQQAQVELATAPAKIKAQGARDVAIIKGRTELAKSAREGATESERIASKEKLAAMDEQVRRDLDENETLRSTRDNETQIKVQEMQDATRRIEAGVEQSGVVSPVQEAGLERIKGNNVRLAGVESDMAAAIERTGDPNDPSVLAFASARDAIIEANATLQESIAEQSEAGATITPAAQPTAEATAEGATEPDVNNDGKISADEQRFNKVDDLIRRKKELLEGGLLTSADFLKLEDEKKRLQQQILGTGVNA